MDIANLNQQAQILKSLHQPGRPLILANAYDIPSAHAIASLPGCRALATASFAVALAAGTEDKLLTLEGNLQAVRPMGQVARDLHKPLTVDLQDGYGARLDEAVTGVIERGAVGCNLEDCDMATGELYPAAVAERRIAQALAVARAQGVAEFVVNARCDVLLHGGEIEEVVRRGEMYLAAGATSVFVLGGQGRGGVKREEIERLVQAFGGRLNVSCVLAPGMLKVDEIAELGVSRISVGPQMLFKAMEAVKREAEMLLGGS